MAESNNNNSAETLFQDVSGDQQATVIESMCMNCHDNGTTNLLLTKIPFFQEVVIMSFFCEHCGFRNNELQTAGKLKDKGARINLRCTYPKDLNRDVIKSEYATVFIPELDFEIPASNKKGNLNTIEGLLQNSIDGLSQDQERRKEEHPEVYEKIKEFIAKLEKMKNGEGFPFRIIIDDPSGNSFVKNPFAPNSDPEMKIEKYYRTKEQCEAMGYDWENAQAEQKEMQAHETEEEAKLNTQAVGHKQMDFTKPLQENQLKEEGLIFKTPCHECHAGGETKMCTITIPYFKELIIMAFSCDECGAKSREVKTGGSISDQAKRITLKVKSEDDLRRDIFKSDTAMFKIPELEIEMLMGQMGGIYSTVEGILKQVKETLFEDNPFVGDSDVDFKGQMKVVLQSLEDCIELRRPFSIVLDDPMANSFVQNPNYPSHDPNVEVEIYDRTKDQNEDLGLNDMKTENYQ
jgi:zinc finger protein